MSWEPVCKVAEVPADDVLPVKVKDQPLAVCAFEGRYFVFPDRCTHEDVALSNGFLEGCEIECPLHGSRFDIRTGKCLTPPADQDMATFETRVDDGTVYVNLEQRRPQSGSQTT